MSKERKDEPDEKKGLVLHRAVQRGDMDGLRNLLAGGADPNAADEDGRTAMHLVS